MRGLWAPDDTTDNHTAEAALRSSVKRTTFHRSNILNVRTTLSQLFYLLFNLLLLLLFSYILPKMMLIHHIFFFYLDFIDWISTIQLLFKNIDVSKQAPNDAGVVLYWTMSFENVLCRIQMFLEAGLTARSVTANALVPVLKGSRSYLSQTVIIDCCRKGEKKQKQKQSFKLQERGTALKNKGDRCQYINFMRMKKKKIN